MPNKLISLFNDDSLIIERYDNEIIIDGMPIADVNNPRLPNDYFNQILMRLGEYNIPKKLFSKIIRYNILARDEILKESSLISNDVAHMLSKIITYEVNLISTCD